jgi:hypothetical protein
MLAYTKQQLALTLDNHPHGSGYVQKQHKPALPAGKLLG